MSAPSTMHCFICVIVIVLSNPLKKNLSLNSRSLSKEIDLVYLMQAPMERIKIAKAARVPKMMISLNSSISLRKLRTTSFIVHSSGTNLLARLAGFMNSNSIKFLSCVL